MVCLLLVPWGYRHLLHILESLRDLPGQPGGVRKKRVEKAKCISRDRATEEGLENNTEPRLEPGRDARIKHRRSTTAQLKTNLLT